MHIVLLNDDAFATAKGGAKGGAVVIVENLRRGFAARGHKVTFITTHRNDGKDDVIRSEDSAGTTMSIGVSYPYHQRHRKCLSIPYVAAHLDTIFSELKPDIVNAHNIHTYLTYESLLIAKKYTSRIFLTAHDTYLISFERVGGAKYQSLEVQGKEWKMNALDHVIAAGRKYWPLRNGRIKSILKKSQTHVIGISDTTKRFLEANSISVPSVIPNGIDRPHVPNTDDVQAFRERFGLTGPTILFAGRVREDKGVPELLQTADLLQESVPDVQILIAGDEKRMKRFLGRCSKKARQAIIVTDWLESNEIALAYGASDIVAVPSVYLDNFPTVNLEALAHGKPVVGTCFGGTKEVVTHGETGFIRNPKETKMFAEAFLTLLHNPDLRAQMGEAGRKRIEEHFSYEKQLDRYLELFGADTMHP
jgi:glycosyltransferase involved in cell wall biosynthesis